MGSMVDRLIPGGGEAGTIRPVENSPQVIAQPKGLLQGSSVAQPNGGAGLNPNTLLGKAFQQAQQQGVISPVSQPQVRPLGLLFNPDGSYPTDKPLPQSQSQGIASIAQKQPTIKNQSKYNQILAAIQKKKGMAKGGRVGYADGSQPQISQQQVAMAITMLKKGADMDTISSVTGIPPQMIQSVISKLQQGIQQQAPGGIAGYKKGGIPEIDYRDKGGYVPPIGKKERADDIPAMLSNNEFVFTANAVRNAGGGDVKHGAKKMYALMKKLEKGMA